MLSHDRPWIPRTSVMAYISPVTAITIQLDLQLTRDVSHMVTWALYDVIKHYCQYSIHMLCHNQPWIPHASIMAYISPVTAITIQIDLHLTHDVSHMVTWALYDVIKHYCQYSIHMLSHNRPWMPHTSVMTTFHP